jgi:hypothetical protein
MLLRRESLEPPMSQLGQKAKYSLRVDVVRCCPNNRHAANATPCPFGAKPGSRGSHSITSSATASGFFATIASKRRIARRGPTDRHRRLEPHKQ